MRLILVRHAMPELDPATPPARWRLSATGRTAAESLTLPPDSYLVASTEPKAAETLAAAADGVVHRDAGFDEVRRPSAWRDDHREQARAYVEGTCHHGWQPQHEVAARFAAAITRHAARAAHRPLVVGSHGMALTCWLTAEHLIPTAPGAFWAALAFPDVIEVDLPAPGAGAR